MESGKRYAVYSIKQAKNGSIWVKAGSAFVNRDGSLNVYLDVLPLDGQLHVREPTEKKIEASAGARAPLAADSELAHALGGH